MKRKLRGLIEAVSDGFRAAGLQGQMATLEARRPGARGRAGDGRTGAASPAPCPARPLPDQDALELVRSLIERIELHPMEGGGFEIEVAGDIAAMTRLAQQDQATTSISGRTPEALLADHPLFACSLKVVAGTGNHRWLMLPPIIC